MKAVILSACGGVIIVLSGCQYSSPHSQAISQSGTDGTPQPVASPFPDQPAGGMN